MPSFISLERKGKSLIREQFKMNMTQLRQNILYTPLLSYTRLSLLYFYVFSLDYSSQDKEKDVLTTSIEI